MRNFRKFKVYQKAMSLTFEVYDLASDLPDIEKYGLRSQITRCAVSIPSNIAEGAGRETTKDFVRFLNIAIGSLYELETQVEIIKHKIEGDLVSEELLETIFTLQKQLTVFINTVKRNG